MQIRHWTIRTAAGLVTALSLAATVAAQHNTQRIVVPADGQGSGVARPYGSDITFANLTGEIGSVEVLLHNVHHTNPDDMDVLLVSPAGRTIVLMSDAGGGGNLRGATLRFSASAPQTVPDSSALTDGMSYRPANYNGGDTDGFPGPAPAGPYSTDLKTLAGDSPNGTWRLYVSDDAADNAGEIQAWTIALTLVRNYGSPGAINANMGLSTPYPSTIAVQNVPGSVRSVRIYLRMTSPAPEDLDILLVGPAGKKMILMSDAGGANAISNRVVQFVDGADPVPQLTAIQAATYRPTNYGANDAFMSPAPAGPYATQLSTFNGISPNGNWQLYVMGDGGLTSGTIHSWTLSLETTLSYGDSQPAILSPSSSTTTTTFVPLQVAGTPGGVVTWRHFGTGDSGVAEETVGQCLATYRTNIPMPESINQFTISYTDVNGGRVSELRTVNAPEFTQMFAEGATGPFFDLDYVIANPNGNTAPMTVQFLAPSGPLGTKTYSLPARTRMRVSAESLANEFPGIAETAVSAVVTSTDSRPLVAERAMFWDTSYYGGHAGTAVEGPSETWYFAEGSQGFFDTFLLLANPSAGKSADVTVTFLVEGASPVTANYTLPPNTRQNVWAAEFPDLAFASFGIKVTANEPIVAERAMYFTGASGQFFGGGHESAGVTEPSKRWIFAEGATGPYFDCYILLGNPNGVAATVALTFFTDAGQVYTTSVSIPGNSRRTVNIEDVDPGLANVAVSTTVASTVPIMAERAMYWPGPFTSWHEAHNSFGVTAAGERWAVADARQGGAQGFDSYVLLVNPEPVEAVVKLTFFRSGVAPVVKTITVPATSRRNVTLSADAPELLVAGGLTEYSVFVETQNRTHIVVEKAMYWNANGVAWAGGSNVAGTRLP